MPPAGLLAIIALGLVIAYVLPQRLRERGTYALVRTEDRYSADMRVVRSSAQRLENQRERPSHSGEVPLLVTGAVRAQIAQLGDAHMSRPAGPLDRAATAAQRERIAMHRDTAGLRAARAAAARRRATVATVTFLAAAIAWVFVAATGLAAIVAALATTLLVAVVGFGARVAAAERKADRDIRALEREVEVTATATQALRVVARARAEGREVAPSSTATQAIRIVTTEDLAPLAVPAPLPAPEIAPMDVPVESPAEAVSPWDPKTMPVPAYALKPAVRQQTARPLSEQDYAASLMAAQRAARAEAAAERAAAAREAELASTGGEAGTASGSLDSILARRRASAS